ncbi:MAG: hypothetical protein AABW54_01010 [Candidatus Micrarchaeota archaeon]
MPKKTPHKKRAAGGKRGAPTVESKRKFIIGAGAAAAAGGLGAAAWLFERRKPAGGKKEPTAEERRAPPKLEVYFSFGGHGGKPDFEHHRKAIADAQPDAIAMEGYPTAAWREDAAKADAFYAGYYQRSKAATQDERQLAAARLNAIPTATPLEGFKNALRAEQVKRAIPEIRLENPPVETAGEIASGIEMMAGAEQAAMQLFTNGKPNEAMREMGKAALLRRKVMIEAREKCIIDELNGVEMRDRLLRQYPHLKELDKVRLLIMIGSAHSHISSAVKNAAGEYHETKPVLDANGISIPRVRGANGLPLARRQPPTPESLAKELVALAVVGNAPHANMAQSAVACGYAQVLAEKFGLEEIIRATKGRVLTPDRLDKLLKEKSPHGLYATPEQMRAFVVEHYRKHAGVANVFTFWKRELK